MPLALDPVFRALADPNRRRLLDRLRERNGQTLGELTAGLAMTRQSASQHLVLLEAADLVSTVRRGRQKLHYLNPVPLQEIQDRWIAPFDRPRLRALHDLRRRAEESPVTPTEKAGPPATSPQERPSFVYVTYIEATPEQVWRALTDAELTAAYWGHSNVSDWLPGSGWEHRRTDGSEVADVVGTVLESDPPRRLRITFGDVGGGTPGGPSVVTFELEPFHAIVRLTVTHERLPDAGQRELAAVGWASVLSNLKTLLETGHVLPTAPWEMHAEHRAAAMAGNGPR